MSRTSESVAMALARPTRCCIPPDSWWGYLSSQPASPTISNASRALALVVALRPPLPPDPSRCYPGRCNEGNRAKCWNTMLSFSSLSCRSSLWFSLVRSTPSTSTEPPVGS